MNRWICFQNWRMQISRYIRIWKVWVPVPLSLPSPLVALLFFSWNPGFFLFRLSQPQTFSWPSSGNLPDWRPLFLCRFLSGSTSPPVCFLDVLGFKPIEEFWSKRGGGTWVTFCSVLGTLGLLDSLGFFFGEGLWQRRWVFLGKSQVCSGTFALESFRPLFLLFCLRVKGRDLGSYSPVL